MYNKIKPGKTSLHRNTSYTGETIEKKINRIVNNKEPIKDGAPIIYTDRRDGVKPEYDIRTDRFELAVEAMDSITKTHQAKRADTQQKKTDKEKADKLIQEQAIAGMKKENTGGEPLQATDN